MRTWYVLALASLILPVGFLGTAALAAAEGPAKEPPPKASPSEAAAAKIEKQLTYVEERMSALQTEEMELTLNMMRAQQKAMEGIKEPDKLQENIDKNKNTPEIRQYKQVFTTCAQQMAALDGKYVALAGVLRGVERERSGLPAEIQTKIDDLMTKVAAKHRANLEKIAGMYEKIGDWKNALAIYKALYQSIPEDKRAAEKGLLERIANACDKSGDPRTALEIYLKLYNDKPEKERQGNTDMKQKLADLYEKVGDYRKALEMWRSRLELIPADKRNSDGKWIKDKIANCEKKLGSAAGKTSGDSSGKTDYTKAGR